MMKDAYNTAVEYLKQKYYTPVLTVYGDVLQRIVQNHDDHELLLLVKQYYNLSHAPKVELEYKLTRMEIPFEKRYT
jgi:hypothetical protein